MKKKLSKFCFVFGFNIDLTAQNSKRVYLCTCEVNVFFHTFFGWFFLILKPLLIHKQRLFFVVFSTVNKYSNHIDRVLNLKYCPFRVHSHLLNGNRKFSQTHSNRKQ